MRGCGLAKGNLQCFCRIKIKTYKVIITSTQKIKLQDQNIVKYKLRVLTGLLWRIFAKSNMGNGNMLQEERQNSDKSLAFFTPQEFHIAYLAYIYRADPIPHAMTQSFIPGQ
jgi:hypothetical protein